LALQAASSDTSTSTTARIQASYAIVTDFFNGLLGVVAEKDRTTPDGKWYWKLPILGKKQEDEDEF
jgi:hypothetical protein